MTAEAAAPGTAHLTDAERDSTVERLRTAVGQGRLDLTEFDRRAEHAYAATGRAELSALVADLAPRGPLPPRMAGPPATAVPATAVPAARILPGSALAPRARFGAIVVAGGMVATPTGSFPLAGSVWRCYDYWHTRRVTPGWAVAAAVLGFFVVPFVSLLFLLVRQDRTVGTLQVAAYDGARQHVVDLPVGSPLQASVIAAQVAQVQALADAEAAR